MFFGRFFFSFCCITDDGGGVWKARGGGGLLLVFLVGTTLRPIFKAICFAAVAPPLIIVREEKASVDGDTKISASSREKDSKDLKPLLVVERRIMVLLYLAELTAQTLE